MVVLREFVVRKLPTEAAGINLNLRNDKIHDLIVKSTEPKNFATQLGKQVEKINIVNEKDCIKISPKMWIDKQIWREINDILRLSGLVGCLMVKIVVG